MAKTSQPKAPQDERPYNNCGDDKEGWSESWPFDTQTGREACGTGAKAA